MPNKQYARGIFAGFGTIENPFQGPNGMEENLRLIDDHLSIRTLAAPQAPDTAYPDDPTDGDGQIYTDGTYSIYNDGNWKNYPARPGVVATVIGAGSWRNTGTSWEDAVPVASLTFQQTGSRATPRSMLEKERERWDLKDFVGSTFTDKLINGLTECLGNGYELILPIGENVLEANVEIPVDAGAGRMSMRGAGSSASIIRSRGTGIRLVLGNQERVEFADFGFICDDPVYADLGTALKLEWSGMTVGRGWKLDNVHFGFNDARPESTTSWLGTGLHVKGKGGGIITRCWFAGKADVVPKGTGLIIEDCKEVDVLDGTAFYNLALGATSNGQGQNEGIKFSHITMVRMGTAMDMGASVGLPNFQLQDSHIAFIRTGIKLTGMTQSWIVDNLFYGRTDTDETTQEDIYLVTCPSAVVSRNRFFSGRPRGAGITKVAITIDGSCRNSEYKNNLFSQRDIGIRATTNDQGLRDSVLSDNRSEIDLVGSPTTGKVYDIPDYNLHRRVRWSGYGPSDLTTKLQLPANLTVPQNTWTVIPFGNPAGANPDLMLRTTGNAGEYYVPYVVSSARLRASVRVVTTSGSAAGSCALRLMQNRGLGWVEVGFTAVGGADVTLQLTLEDLDLQPGAPNTLRFEVFHTAAGGASAYGSHSSARFTPQ